VCMFLPSRPVTLSRGRDVDIYRHAVGQHVVDGPTGATPAHRLTQFSGRRVRRAPGS